MPKRNVDPEVARARATLAGLIRRSAKPELIESARRSLADANVKVAAERLKQQLPGDSDRRKLARLILAGSGGDAT